jgi:hypothetical protein
MHSHGISIYFMQGLGAWGWPASPSPGRHVFPAGLEGLRPLMRWKERQPKQEVKLIQELGRSACFFPGRTDGLPALPGSRSGWKLGGHSRPCPTSPRRCSLLSRM